MQCLGRNFAWYKKELNPSGKRGLTFSYKESRDSAFYPNPLLLPCGKCVHCRINQARSWAIRASHEAHMAKQGNYFVLLTYDDQNLPPGGHLNKEHVKTFLKDLRSQQSYHFDNYIRTFGCAEYGDRHSRPHYHINIFNLILTDPKTKQNTLIKLKNLKTGSIYQSKILTDLWGRGAVTVSEFTPLTAQYTAKYIVKKAVDYDSQQSSLEHEAREQATETKGGSARQCAEGAQTVKRAGEFEGVEGSGGEAADAPLLSDSAELPPEGRIATSTHPGLGYAFLEKYHRSIASLGAIELDGALAPLPAYYKKKMQEKFPESYKIYKKNLGKFQENGIPSLVAPPSDSEVRALTMMQIRYIEWLKKNEGKSNET